MRDEHQKPQVLNVCVSEKRGLQKRPVEEIRLIAGHGIEGDAHAGDWHRQVSLLADEDAQTMRDKGVTVQPGDFGENILTRGIDLARLAVGTVLRIADAELEVTQIGKACHTQCAIYDAAGTCVMPTNGVFCRVTKAGIVRPGDTIRPI